MPAYKDRVKGTWSSVLFTIEKLDRQKEKKMKRGFKTRQEALGGNRFSCNRKPQI